MIAYKGFTKDLTATCGKGTMQYAVGQTYEEDNSKCARNGMHCAEYPPDSFSFYPPGRTNNRYFEVDASGSIDETAGNSHVSCTRMTLLRELSIKQMVIMTLAYMVKHPLRKWEARGSYFEIAKDSAIGCGYGAVAVARGEEPKVKGRPGSILGLYEEKDGSCTGATVLEAGVNGIKSDTWYTLRDGKIMEVSDETQRDRKDKAHIA